MDGLLKAIKQQGGLTALGESLGVSKGVIYQWRKRGQVPPPFCPEIEKLTCGSVLCEQLNDTVDWAYVRKSNRRRSTDKNQ
jgi:DNA-binding transcriptional regulator YdaS (Cro superfamily)